MKLFLSTLLVFSIFSSTSFAQKARVLLAYNAFNSDKDTLQIGDTVSYNSENLNGKENELIFLKENAYLALMNENGSILEWKNKETGNYKIEFDESDTTFNAVRKYIVRGSVLDRMYKNRDDKKYMYLGMSGTHITRCFPKEIRILAQPKSTYLRDSLKIFARILEYSLREEEEMKPNTLEIEIKDMRNSLITTHKLDTNFFVFNWNNLPNYKKTIITKQKVKGKLRKQNIKEEIISKPSSLVIYSFSIQTNKGRKIESYACVLAEAKQPVSYQENYFQSKEQTTIGVFLQFLYSCKESDLNIYSCQLYHDFLEQMPKEAHSIVPTWKEFKENYQIGY